MIWPNRNTFKAIKQKLTQAPILSYLDFKLLSIFYTDANEDDAAGFSIPQIQDRLKQQLCMG